MILYTTIEYRPYSTYSLFETLAILLRALNPSRFAPNNNSNNKKYNYRVYVEIHQRKSKVLIYHSTCIYK